MSARDTFNAYGAALAAGDMPALAATFADDIVWHQPGRNSLSGDHHGPDAVLELLGSFMQRSGGTFELAVTGVVESGDLVAAAVNFSARRQGEIDLAQNGIDVFHIANGRIAEVWLVSTDQDAEDRFWG
ncbi:nuclear transport factor 2 family protein [Nocardia asteroides]|uniref:nuclear transport factor 2 family protein n=1 Tax=Nocardia asteroides TaxID=1824 RepID=UPI003437311A